MPTAPNPYRDPPRRARLPASIPLPRPPALGAVVTTLTALGCVAACATGDGFAIVVMSLATVVTGLSGRASVAGWARRAFDPGVRFVAEDDDGVTIVVGRRSPERVEWREVMSIEPANIEPPGGEGDTALWTTTGPVLRLTGARVISWTSGTRRLETAALRDALAVVRAHTLPSRIRRCRAALREGALSLGGVVATSDGVALRPNTEPVPWSRVRMAGTDTLLIVPEHGRPTARRVPDGDVLATLAAELSDDDRALPPAAATIETALAARLAAVRRRPPKGATLACDVSAHGIVIEADEPTMFAVWATTLTPSIGLVFITPCLAVIAMLLSLFFQHVANPHQLPSMLATLALFAIVANAWAYALFDWWQNAGLITRIACRGATLTWTRRRPWGVVEDVIPARELDTMQMQGSAWGAFGVRVMRGGRPLYAFAGRSGTEMQWVAAMLRAWLAATREVDDA